ncbi:hypothetical protein BHE74_00030068 [Ensete ventricosum]|nr:hypothetical protein BHE74_00030068 [Ensete ventricosum]
MGRFFSGLTVIRSSTEILYEMTCVPCSNSPGSPFILLADCFPVVATACFPAVTVDFANVLGLPPLSFPLVVSQTGQMSSTSSHSESRSVEMSTRRSRALSRPFGDSRSSALVSVFEGVAPTDPGTTYALVAISLSTDALEVGLRFRLHPVMEACLKGCLPTEWTSRMVNNLVPALSVDETELVEILRGILSASKGVLLIVPYYASRSTTRVPSGKGKEPVVMEEASKRGYTLRELCEVEDRMGAERYFTTVMTRLKVAECEDPLMPRWSAIAGSS